MTISDLLFGEEKAPDGTPLSDWELRTFVPQPDITVQELATIMWELHLWGGGVCEDRSLIYFKKSRDPWISIYEPGIIRHFKLVSSISL